MSRHIGIVACTAEGAALCYRTICVEQAVGERWQVAAPSYMRHAASAKASGPFRIQ
ncbi:MAG TPA: hypothetical protein VGO53_05955 [Steroidobacteraceae bacterium]|jgi:aspartate racemase|nr:hypothetical protein [Steroidobacteraceae bacterium]